MRNWFWLHRFTTSPRAGNWEMLRYRRPARSAENFWDMLRYNMEMRVIEKSRWTDTHSVLVRSKATNNSLAVVNKSETLTWNLNYLSPPCRVLSPQPTNGDHWVCFPKLWSRHIQNVNVKILGNKNNKLTKTERITENYCYYPSYTENHWKLLLLSLI